MLIAKLYLRYFALLVLFSFSTAALADNPKPYLLHLPGIAGPRGIDRRFTTGLTEGGFDGTLEVYDWTENDPGLNALVSQTRNRKEAAIIADKITRQRQAAPNGKIYVTSHSGGGGLAIFSLEALPANVQIDDLVMMSPALSPGYDLSAALKHVNGHVYMFSSLADIIVLGTGTTLFGTIDGVKSDSAGRVGFTMPAGGDAVQYKKLVQLPYDPSWEKYGNHADHIGGMTRLFSKNIVAPLLFQGVMPKVDLPTTMETPTGLGRALPHPTTQPAH